VSPSDDLVAVVKKKIVCTPAPSQFPDVYPAVTIHFELSTLILNKLRFILLK